jgi:predicted nucleic-acid-binding protein
MIAIDTNVLVRYLADDDPVQSPVAARLIERAMAAGESILIPTVVLVETAWVLARAYKVGRAELVRIVDAIVRARHFAFADPTLVSRASRAYAAGSADFSDYLVLEEVRMQEGEALVTFDKALWKEEGARRPA